MELELATTQELIAELEQRENVEFVACVRCCNNCGVAEFMAVSKDMTPSKAKKMLRLGLESLGA